MNFTNQALWARAEELARDLSQVPHEQLPERLSQLADAGEAPTVTALLTIWLSVPPAPAVLAPGTLLAGRYVLREQLGEGGMGVVWRASQEMISMDVAVKIIHPSLVTPQIQAQFVREMKILGQLKHPGIIRITDAGMHNQPDGALVPFFVMELIEGQPLDQWAAPRRSQPVEILRVASEICSALGNAHEREIVHRDLKPRNVMVRANGQPVILDFGIARLRGAVLGEEEGAFSGTPQYAAPEQHLGRDHDFRSGESVDIYALGAVLFELLSGRRLFEFGRGASIAEMRRAVLEAPTPRLSEVVKDCPPALEEVVHRAIRRDPADRFHSIAGFGRAIDRVASSLASPPSPPPRWAPAPRAIIPRTSWVLLEKLGEGGAGEVWLGAHKQLEERRVFKFCDTEEKARTLKREVTLFRLLRERVGRNPHFVALHEVSLDEPPYYLMMEHVEARELEAWCESRPGGLRGVPEAIRLEIIIQAAEALQSAHEAGILHRDIKPANLLVRDDRGALHVWVADFGIGLVVTDQLLRNVTRLGFTRTVSGLRTNFAGTPLYLAPEVLEGATATARSDIYSLGVVLWQLLAGSLRTALDPSDWAERIQDHLLRDIVRRCLAGAPEKRWASAGELAANLRSIPEKRADEQRRAGELKAREQAAYRRGLLRASAMWATVVVLLGGLVTYAFEMTKRERTARAEALLREAQTLETSFAPDASRRALERIQRAAPLAGPKQISELRECAVFHLCRPGAENANQVALLGPAGATANSQCTYLGLVLPDRRVRISRIDGGSLEQGWTTEPLPNGVSGIRPSPSGSRVVAVGDGRSVWLAQRTAPAWRQILNPTGEPRLCWTGADELVVETAETTLKLPRPGQESKVIELRRSEALPPGVEGQLVGESRISLLAADSAGRWLAVGRARAQSLRLGSLSSRNRSTQVFEPRPISAFAWGSAAREEQDLNCAVGCDDGSVNLWSVSRGPDGAPLAGVGPVIRPDTAEPLPPVTGLAWHPDGGLIAVLHADSVVRLWRHSWKSGRWSLSAVFAVEGEASDIFFQDSGRMVIRAKDGTYIAVKQHDELFFRERRLDQFPVVRLATAFDRRVGLGVTSGAIFAFEPLSLGVRGRTSSAFLTRAQVHPVSRELFYSDREGVHASSWGERGPGGWNPNGPLILERALDFRLAAEPGMLFARGPDGLVAFRPTGGTSSLLLGTPSVVDWEVSSDGRALAVRRETKPGIDLYDTGLDPLLSSNSPVALRLLRNVAVEVGLSMAFSRDGQKLFVVTRDTVESHPLNGKGPIQRFANEAPHERRSRIPLVEADGVIATLNTRGDPILVAEGKPGSDFRLALVLRRASTSEIRDLAFAGAQFEVLIAGTEEGMLQAWRLDQLERKLGEIGLGWVSPPFGQTNGPEGQLPATFFEQAAKSD